MKGIFSGPYSKISIISLVVFVITAIFSKGFLHADEHFQILEFASYKLGRVPVEDLAWEFQSKVRPCLQPFLALSIIKALMAIGISNPFTHTTVLRLFIAIISWFLIIKTGLLLVDNFKTERGKKYFLGIITLLWFIPFCHARFSSEIASGMTFLAALLPFLKKGEKRIFSYLFSGLLIGLSFYFRFQIAFAFIGLLIWLIFNKTKISHLALLLAGGLISVLFGMLLDYSFYDSFTFTPWNYFEVNILKGTAAGFGVSPFWGYLTLTFFEAVPPIGLTVLALIAIGYFKNYKNLLGLVFISFLFFHSLVGHKEMRFMFPVLFATCYLAALGLEKLFLKHGSKKLFNITLSVLVYLNMTLLVYRAFVPRDLINFQQHIYELAEEEEITILSIKETPYDVVGLEMNFYKSPNVELVTFENLKDLNTYLVTSNKKNQYFFHQKLQYTEQFEAYTAERSYTVLPDWILKHNINNWQDRTRMWSLHRLIPINK